VASLPNRMKPATGGEESDESSHQTLRGVRGRRVRKERPGTWEARKIVAGVGQPIVAEKRVMTVERRG
jgi:hypothetical protein